MRYLLDTVAISETSKIEMQPGMANFLATTESDELRLSVITIGEIHFGWNRLPTGQRRIEFENWANEVEVSFVGRILDVDMEVAKVWGAIREETKSRRFTIPVSDLFIAATALHHDLTVVTRNVKDFTPTGCKILNPWESELE